MSQIEKKSWPWVKLSDARLRFLTVTAKSCQTKSLEEVFVNKTLMLISAAAVFSLLATDSALAGGRDRADRRQTHQNARTAQGMASGEISPAEAHRLRESRRAIRRTENRAEADGEVTKREAAHIENMQDRRSKQIDRLKHNEVSRPNVSEPAPVEEKQ